MKFLIFGFGNFGRGIARHALQDGHSVKLYIRESSLEKRKQDIKAIEAEYKQKEGSIEVVLGSITDEAKVRSAAKDVDVAICCISVAEDKTWKGIYNNYLEELHIVNALTGLSNLKRYLPNQWAQMATIDGQLFTPKALVAQKLVEKNIPFTLVHCGWLMDIAPVFALERFETENSILLTSLDDLSRVVPRIAVDPRTLNKSVVVYGDRLNQKQLFEALGKDSSKLPVKTKEQLKQCVAEKKENNQMSAIEEYAYSFWFAGDGDRMDNALDIHQLYPEEKFSTLVDAVKHNKFSFKTA